MVSFARNMRTLLLGEYTEDTYLKTEYGEDADTRSLGKYRLGHVRCMHRGAPARHSGRCMDVHVFIFFIIGQSRTGARRYDEPRHVWTSGPITH